MKAHAIVVATLCMAAAGLAIGCSEKKQSSSASTKPPAQAQASTAAAPQSTQPSSPAAASTSSSAAHATPAQTQPAATLPQATRSTAAPTGSAVDVVNTLRPSVVRVRTDASQVGAFGTVQKASGTGTGIIIDGDGHVVTNNHVVTIGTDQPASKITVDLSDGQSVSAQIVGRDQNSDLAVLKISANNLTPAKLADPKSIQVGEDVIAIGYALDLGSTPSVTRGVVSALGREIDETLTSSRGLGGTPNIVGDAIQTDAAVNPGNSGGPLVDMNGNVIGINTAGIFSQASSGTPVQGINFAVSVETVQPVVTALITKGKVDRGFMGVQLVPITPDEASALKAPVPDGAGIEQVQRGTPADQAGLQAGDIIVKAGGKDIHGIGDLQQVLIQNGPGAKLHVEYYRGADRRAADITLSSRPSAA
jgi:S1-C subfamily serine protease